jgi:hypothetical protein
MSDRCDVLQDHESRSHQANDTHELVEQPAPGALTDASASSGLGDVLAGEATDNEIGSSSCWRVGADVVMDGNPRKVFGKDALAVRLAFYELNRFNPAKPAGSEAESADAAEGVDHAQSHATTPTSTSCITPPARRLRLIRGRGGM